MKLIKKTKKGRKQAYRQRALRYQGAEGSQREISATDVRDVNGLEQPKQSHQAKAVKALAPTVTACTKVEKRCERVLWITALN